jgi:DNA primase
MINILGVLAIATRIPEALVEEIREKVNIVDVISPYVQLKKQGRNLFGLCPFHEERTGSFSVNEEKQIFHCFSCGRGGNVYSFMMDIENLTFPQAVAKVAPFAGVDLDASYTADESVEVVDPEIKALRELYAEATKLYHHILVNTEAGEEALDYLHSRGLDDGTIDAFMLGYAPDTNVLFDYFTEQGKDYQLLRQSELFVELDDGSLRDRFMGRVLFTIRDAAGHPIAYSGRRLSNDDTQPKYINSPESPLFNKSRELFNLDLAKNSIRKDKSVILFEGFMDVIAAFQAGVTNGVASMGTSLTQEQVQILSRMADKIFVSYDSDNAGQAATKRALDLVAQNGRLDATVIHIPNDQDPDEYLRANGVDEFLNVLNHATEDPIAFNIRYLRSGRDLNNQQEMFNYVSDVLGVISTVKEPVIRDTYLRQLSEEFNLGVDALQDQIRPLLLQAQAQRTSSPRLNRTRTTSYDGNGFDESSPWGAAPDDAIPVVPAPRQSISRIERSERILMAWMLQDQEVWLQVTSMGDFHFADANYETLLLLATAYKTEHGNETITDMAGFMDFVQRPELMRILAALDEVPAELMQDHSHVNDYIQVIVYKEPLSVRIKTLQRQISEAKMVHNAALVSQLSAELITVLREQQAQLKDK